MDSKPVSEIHVFLQRVAFVSSPYLVNAKFGPFFSSAAFVLPLPTHKYVGQLKRVIFF